MRRWLNLYPHRLISHAVNLFVFYKETGDKNVIDTHHFKPESRHLFVAKGHRKLCGSLLTT